MTTKRYDNFPLWIVGLSNCVAIMIYAAGVLILNRVGVLFTIVYLCYVALLELTLLRKHCPDCYYWGKTCGFGKGRLSALMFKKGDNTRFCARKISWKDMIPDMLVSLVPLVVGIILLVVKFDVIILATLVVLLLLTTVGNGYIRGVLTCKNCMQQELGCPADVLFNKEK